MSMAAPAESGYVERRAGAHPSPSPRPSRLAGADRGPPPRLYRLVHLRGQPGPHRRQHPAPSAQPGPVRSAKAPPCSKDWPPAAAAVGASPCTTRARNSTPGYHCASRQLVNGRGVYCLCPSAASQIDQAVTAAFLAALAPAGVERGHRRRRSPRGRPRRRLGQWRRQVEQARYEATKAERRYLAVDPDNRLVARGLEADWETRPSPRSPTAEAELARRAAARPAPLTADQRATLAALGADSARCGRRPPPPTGTAKSCSAPFSRKSASTSGRESNAPSSACVGGAGRSPSSASSCPALHRPRPAPTRTPSRCSAVSPSTTPTPPSPAS